MKAFYLVMIWLLQAEIRIARSTGRNPSDVLTMKHDLHNLKAALHRFEVSHV